MKKIVVASKNPVKINVMLAGFQKMFPEEQFEIEGVSAASGVGDQPKTNAEIFSGALNRAHNACKECQEADFFVGIEGGIEENASDMESFAWVVIRSKNGELGKGKTGRFFLPPKVAALVKEGKELGEADDIVFGRTNSKQENGAVGILTENVVDGQKYYTDAVIMALIPFKNQPLYFI